MGIAAGMEAATQKAKLPTGVAEEITSKVCLTPRHAPIYKKLPFLDVLMTR